MAASIIRARAPLRLGLAGGGTDVTPYCEMHGGYVLNATIDRYAYAVIKPLAGDTLRFCATDQDITVTTRTTLCFARGGDLDLHTAVYCEMMRVFNEGVQLPLELSTFCDAPVGSGLGSSSTLVVAMIRAFAELFELALDDYAIALLAFTIERERCGLKGGRQDQYSATFGGFNFMEFYGDNKAVVTPLRIEPWMVCELEASLILFYTGISRQSGEIIDHQSNNMVNGSVETMEAMHGLKREAARCENAWSKAISVAWSIACGRAGSTRNARPAASPTRTSIRSIRRPLMPVPAPARYPVLAAAVS